MRRSKIIGLCLIVIGLGVILAFSARLWGIIAATVLVVIGAILAFKNRAGNI